MKTIRITLAVLFLLTAAIAAPMVATGIAEMPAAMACDGGGSCF